jgi:Flp pilus assembly protein TadB
MIKSIRLVANIGLYGTLLLSMLTIAEHYLDKYVWVRTITTNEYTRHLFMVVGLVLAVVDIAAVLFAMRRTTPRLRQMDSVDERLAGYRSLIRTTYIATLVVTAIVATVIIVTHENTLIMLLLLLFITLVLNYPNMYKMKADMGLTDKEMKELFGEQYLRNENKSDDHE